MPNASSFPGHVHATTGGANMQAAAAAGLTQSAPEILTRLGNLQDEVEATRDRVCLLLGRISIVCRPSAVEPGEKEPAPDTRCELSYKILEQELQLRGLRRMVDDALARLEI